MVSGAMLVGSSVNEDAAQTRLNNSPSPLKTLGSSMWNLYLLYYFEKDFFLLLMSFFMGHLFTCVSICFLKAMMGLSVSNGEDYPGLSWWVLNAITSFFYKGKRREISHTP